MPSTRLRRRCARGLLLRAALGALAAGVVGCAAVAPSEEPDPPAPTSATPPWDEDALAEHLRFFNSEEVGGRKTGTQGYARAAAYAASRMGAYGLQAAFGDDYRSVYQTSVNYPRSATLQVVRPDTVRFYPGIDFLPGGRSDVGEIRFEEVVAGADAAWQPSRGDVALLRAEQAQTGRLQALREAGARAALVVGDLRPRPASQPVQGLPVVQVTLRTAAQLLDTTQADVTALLREGGRRALPHPVRLRVSATNEPLAGALNVVGYVVGKRPDLAREAVLVCADLDAAGPFAGVRTLDLDNLGTGAAALLEVARREARLARYLTIPERTVIFALWSGARLGHAGLEAYLRIPTWPLSQIEAVVYVGLEADEVPTVEALLAPYDLPLYAVEPQDEAPYTDRLVLMPDAALLQLARERDGSEAAPEPPDVRLSERLREARPVARRLAERTHELVLREAVSSRPLLPTLPDTLRPPEAPIR